MHAKTSIGAEPFPLVQLSPADLATVHATLAARAASRAEAGRVYRREAGRLRALASATPEEWKEEGEAEWIGRLASSHEAKAAEILAEAAELARLAGFFTPDI